MCKKSTSLGKSRNVPNASAYTSGFEYIEAPPASKPFSSSLHSSSSLLSSSLREDDVVNERVATHLKGNLLPPRRLPPLKQNGEEDARKKHRRIVVVIVVKVIIVVIKITTALFQQTRFYSSLDKYYYLRSMRQKVHTCTSRSNEHFHMTDKRETRVSDTFSFPFRKREKLFLW